MATRLESQPYDTATANFKLWAGFIRNLFLTTGGWLAASDTGQTNPTTVGTAPTNGNYIYEIYKANDVLAATAPLYVKVEYGQKNSVPSIAMTIGTGSNGTGTITGGGTRFTHNNLAGSGALAATGYDCIGSADTGSVRFLMWRNHATVAVPCFFAIERSRDATGAATGDFATLFIYGYGIDYAGAGQYASRQQTVLASGAAGNVQPTWLTFQSGLASAGEGANDLQVPFFHAPGYLACASLDLLCSKGADLAEASTNVIQHYGASHTYYCSQAAALKYVGSVGCFQIGSAVFAAVQNNGLAFRYE